MRQARTWWIAVGVAALIALVVVDEVAGVAIAGTFAVAPLVTVVAARPRMSALVGAAATVAALGVSLADGSSATAVVVRVLTVLFAAALAVMAAGAFRADHDRFGEMSRVAEVAQLAVLTPVPATVGPYSLASVYVSASKAALIGGDLYGVVDSPFGLRLIVGDVRGKGLDAVSLAATTLTTFRELAGSARDLRDIATRLDRRLAPGLGVEDFVTAVIGGLSVDGTIELVNCGHPPPLVFRGGSHQFLETETPTAPLGLGPEPSLQRYTLRAGERLFFYTDGLVEARARYGGFIDLEAAVGAVGAAPMDSALGGVLRRVREQSGDEHRDDVALLLIEYAQRVPSIDLERAHPPGAVDEGRPGSPERPGRSDL